MNLLIAAICEALKEQLPHEVVIKLDTSTHEHDIDVDYGDTWSFIHYRGAHILIDYLRSVHGPREYIAINDPKLLDKIASSLRKALKIAI